ncbi:uncharacterized protein CDAR_50291 [Caerostris darwini]|uniref:Amiloride-sensitive sodium channel n=1 Tax=Caerostris darwini TaxID=1538125 RepID=A0AAV4UWW9_9ARAC|nr:uncharacterized protein CDAR_50291 [Caerostris darwini]
MTPKEARRLELACGLLKAAVFMSCAAGFTYQVVEFALHFWTYPTNINLEVTHPGKFMAPAFTYCNLNPVQRTRYCAKYPDRCAPPENLKKFCEQRPHYCTGNTSNLVIPLPKYYIPYTYLPENHITYSDMIELKQNFSAFRERTYLEHDFTAMQYKRKRPVFFHGFNGVTNYQGCFTENTRFNNKAKPIIQKFDRPARGQSSTAITYLQLHVEPGETFHPWGEPGVIFTIHSPFVAVNPFLKGNVLRPGSSYNIHVRLLRGVNTFKSLCDLIVSDRIFMSLDRELITHIGTKQNLTLSPKRKKSTYFPIRTRRTVQTTKVYGSLITGLALAHSRCPYELIMYENPEDRCNKSSDFYCERKEQMLEELEECRDNCKPDCVTVYISVTVDEPEVHVVSHKPQYMGVELFSYVGGFMGCWLGLSVWALVDALEGLMRKGPLMPLIKLTPGYPYLPDDNERLEFHPHWRGFLCVTRNVHAQVWMELYETRKCSLLRLESFFL